MQKLITLAVVVTFAVLSGCDGDSSSGQGSSSLPERKGIIQRKGIPMTLLGPALKVGQKAPDFTVIDTEFNEISLSSYRGKIVVLSSIPSIDTPMCKLQTHRFDEEAKKASKDVVYLTLSVDLPFAQKRWCDAEGVHTTVLLSDFRNRDFAEAYGLLIKERMLLARAVFVIDRDGVIRYIQIVKEQFAEPDYENVLNTLNDVLGAT